MSTVIAYLDAGTGSQIAALVAGGFAAFAVTAKMYWNRILVFLHIRKPEDETTTGAPPRVRTPSSQRAGRAHYPRPPRQLPFRSRCPRAAR